MNLDKHRLAHLLLVCVFVVDLKIRNAELQQYADDLVAQVLEEAPNALCAQKHMTKIEKKKKKK